MAVRMLRRDSLNARAFPAVRGDEAASQLRAVEPRKGGASHSTRPSATQVQRTSMDAPRCRAAAELVRVARRGVGVGWHSGKRYAGQCAVGAPTRQRWVA